MRFGDIILMACGSGDMMEKRRLHKTVYLLTLGSGLEGEFGAGYFGPYSRYVEYDFEKLAPHNFIREEVRPRGNGTVMRLLSLTEQGRAVLDGLIKKYPREYEQIADMVVRINQLEDEELIKATKACMLLMVFSTDEVEEKASRIGWNVSKEDVKEWLEKLERIGFIWWIR